MKQLKLSIYTLFALSFVTFILSFLVLSKRENEKAKRLEAETKVAELTQENERLIEAYDTAKREGQEAQSKLKEEIRHARELEQQLVAEKGEKEKLAGQVSSLSSDLKSITSEYENSKAKYEELAEMVVRLRKRFDEIKAEGPGRPVQLSPAGVKPDSELMGRVLVVNDVFRFVVINLGRQDGLAEGMELSVMRDAGEVARVQVERLYDSLAACTIVNQDEQAPIQVQDLIHT